MKVFESDCTFDYPWEEVSTANWRKYCPWNDKSPHVIAVDTLAREVDPKTGIVSDLSYPHKCRHRRHFEGSGEEVGRWRWLRRWNSFVPSA